MNARKMVMYTGSSDVRSMSEDEWAAAGITGQKALSWDPSNGYAVLEADLTKEALSLLLRDPAEFCQVTADPAEVAPATEG